MTLEGSYHPGNHSYLCACVLAFMHHPLFMVLIFNTSKGLSVNDLCHNMS